MLKAMSQVRCPGSQLIREKFTTKAMYVVKEKMLFNDLSPKPTSDIGEENKEKRTRAREAKCRGHLRQGAVPIQVELQETPFFFFLFKAALVTYGGSQAKGQTGATAAGLHHRTQAVSVTYTTTHGNTRSLTH